jgi:SAM-dependent methyltransferase
MDVKKHYEDHLGYFYSWMIGDFDTKKNEFLNFLKQQKLLPFSNKFAIDLGAGNGIQSIPLAEVGYDVLAVDFSKQLLGELKSNSKDLSITILEEDIRKINSFVNHKAELIVCCGDTLTHLESKNEVNAFLIEISKNLIVDGRLLLTFRDYGKELKATDRFISVKSDDSKILTCFLEYTPNAVVVTDLLHEKINNKWQQKISSYNKVRLVTSEVVAILETLGFKIELNQIINRLTTIVAVKS